VLFSQVSWATRLLLLCPVACLTLGGWLHFARS
jgi:hypothetical protein